MSRHTNAPFYLHVFLNDVHDPFQPAPGWDERFAGKGKSDEDRKFYDVLTAMDRQLGRLFSAVDELGLGKRTLIVLTGDNGPTAWKRYYDQGIEPPGSTAGDRGRKWSLYEGGIREPMILRWKGKIPAGRVDEKSVVTGIDYFPSVAKIAGIKLRGLHLDGEDRSGVFMGKPSGRKKPVFWGYPQDIKPGKPSDVSPLLAMRERDWKLLMNEDGSRVELYDLVADPQESRNLAAAEPKRSRKMSAQLAQWLEVVRAGSPAKGSRRK
jgi:arylsulfatase A-like enzyme